MYRVEPAANHPDVVATVGGWHWTEWGHADPAGQVSWTAGLRHASNLDMIPMLLVALAGNEPVGSITLVQHDMDTTNERWRDVVERWRGLTSWLSGLFVVPEHRGRGIGSQLVRASEAEAHRLGVKRLYVYSSDAEGLYRDKHDDGLLGRDFHEDEAVAVMAKDLLPHYPAPPFVERAGVPVYTPRN